MIAQVFDGATITIETALTPPVTLRLGELASDEPAGPVTQALRPSVAVHHNGQLVYSSAPHGKPDPGLRLVILGAVALVLFLLFA